MNKNRKITIIASAVLVLLIALFAVIYTVTRPQPQEGEKNITITVVKSDKSEEVFNIKTYEKYLAAVLIDNEIVEDNKGDYGLYIVTACGETADSTQEEWWAIYEGEEMASVGAGELPVEDGDSFSLVFTVGYDMF